MSLPPVRFGLVGFGLFGRHYARLIAAQAGAELSGIVAASAASQAAAARDYPQAFICGDYRRLLELPHLDLVAVVAPNWLHYEIGSAVLAAGKHLLLEKPMALRADHCAELCAAARRGNRLLAVGHELRLSSLWGGVQRLIESGAIGEPRYALIQLLRFPYRPGAEGWRYDPARVGNWILEEPIHFLDLARWYLARRGEPAAVYAQGNAARGADPRMLENFSALIHFPGNAYAVVSQTLAGFGHHQAAQIAGSEGAIWATWSAADARSEHPQYSLRYGRGAEVTEVGLEKPAGELLELADQIAALVRCVREGTPPPCTGEDGAWSTRLCLAAEASLQSGQPVPLATIT